MLAKDGGIGQMMSSRLFRFGLLAAVRRAGSSTSFVRLARASCCSPDTLQAVSAAAMNLQLAEEVLRMVRAHGAPLLYLAIIVSGGSSFLQAIGQQHVAPHEAAIIYTLDPVYGALFGWLLLGEELHLLGFVGMALVLAANGARRLPWQHLLLRV